LLLDVGPRSDETIPEKDQQILGSIGDWLRINDEAIDNANYQATFAEGPTAV
jgi:alpha-L-fucosidase